MSTKSLRYNDITRNTVANSQIPMPPVITGYSISGLDDTALDPAGGQTLFVNGKGFQKGATVTLNGSAIGVVSWVSANRLSFTAPAYSAGTYQLYVINPDGGTAIYIPGVVYSTFPTWSTPASPSILSTNYETTSINTSVVATGDAPVTYSIIAGSLPTGATMTSGGVITGTAPADSGSTTYTFTVQADDAQKQSSTRQFSITINTDVVTWVTPSSGSTINLDGTSYSQTLSATDAAGYSVSYTANALPIGLTLTSGTISGTPTTEGSTTTLLTATAATSNRTATNTITWVVSLNDIYWKFTQLLLSASSSLQTQSFASDNSINNAQLTVVGDTRAQSFNPYQQGYYSYYFSSTSPTVGFAQPALGAQFTIEFWVYPTAAGSSQSYYSGGSTTGPIIGFNGATFSAAHQGTWSIAASTNPTVSAWNHIALVREGTGTNQFKLYLNGILVGTGTDATTFGSQTGGTLGGIPGYISNFRITNNQALYLAAFTPPTTPLLNNSGTLLLTANTNRFVDTSATQIALTTANSPSVSFANPFSSTYQAASPYYSVSFNGSSDYLTVPASATHDFGTGDFTIEFWFYANVIGQVQLIDFRDNGANGMLTLYIASATNKFNCESTSLGVIASLSTISPYTWYHIAITRVSTTTKLYLNGTFQSSGTDSTNYTGGATDRIWIGKWGGGASGYFNGEISNFRVVKGQALYTGNFTPSASPLTTSSVGTSGTNVAASITGTVPVLMLRDSTLKDNSTNNFTITSTTTVKPTPVSPFFTNYYSNYFNGSTDYLTLASNSAFAMGSNNFTIECWFNTNSVAGTQVLIDQWNFGSTRFLLRLNTTTVQAYFYTTASQTISGGTVAVNTWYHVALVRNGSTFTLYLNGVSIGTPVTDSNAIASGTSTLGIGGYASANYMSGYISNARIVNGTAIYTAAFTPSTAPLTAVANTSLLTCQSQYFIDTSSNSFTITQVGTPKIVAVAPFTQPTGYSASLLPATYGSGYFNGSTGYLTVPNSTSLDFGTGDFTVEAWVYITAYNAATYEPVFANAFLFYIGSTGQLLIYNGTADVYTGSAGDVPINQWAHVTWVRASGTTKGYVNGINKGSSASVNGAIGSGSPTNKIGNYSTVYFPGYISSVRVIKGTALYTSNFVPQFTSPLSNVTNTQLLTLQTNGSHSNSTFNDTSSFNNLITRNGNVTNGTFSPYGDNWSNYFDGSGDYLTLTGVNLSGTDFTVETWAFFTSFSVTAPHLWCFGTDGSNRYNVWRNNSTGKFSFSTANGGTFDIKDGNTTVALNTWYHIAVVSSSGSRKLYINGVYDGSTSTSAINAGTSWAIGFNQFGGSTDYMTGYISNFRVTKSALYTTNFTPSTAPLTAVTTTQLLTCQSNRLIDNSPNNFTLTKNGDTSVQKFSPFSTVTVPKYYSTYFNGSSDYLTVPSSTAFVFGTGDFTVEMWVYLTTAASNGASTTDKFLFGAIGNTPSWTMYLQNSTSYIPGFYSATGGVSSSITVSAFVWTHLAFVRYNGTQYIYVNGVSGGSTSNSSNYTASGTQYIGRADDAANKYFPGYISNLRVLKGTAAYTTAFTPSTTPLTAVSNTQLLTCQDNTFKDNSTNNFTITAGTTTVKPLQVSPFTPTASLPTSYSPSTFGGSMYFDGTGDYLSIADSPTIEPLTKNFTAECWFYPTGTNPTNGSNLLSKSVSTSMGPFQIGFTTAATSSYLQALGSTDGSSWGISCVSTVSFNSLKNSWNHVALVRNGSTFTLYLNGVSVATTTNAGSLVDNAAAFMIGYINYTATEFPGYITDARYTVGVALYTSTFYPGATPLTSTITMGTTTYSSNLLVSGASGGVIDATRTIDLETVGDAKVTNFSPYNNGYYSNYFDGTGDWLTFTGGTPFNFGSGDFTIEAWVNAQSFGNFGAVFFSNFIPSSFRLIVALSATGVSVDSGGQMTFTGTTTCSLNTWYHCAFVRSGSTFKTFINGSQVATSTYASAYWVTAGTNVTVGDYSDDYSTGYGYVSNLRVIKGQALYSGTFTPSTSPLTITTVGSTGAGAAATITGTVSLLTCQANKFIDVSSNNAIPTVSGNSAVTTQNPFQVNPGQSYYFDGTGDYLTITNNLSNFAFGTGDFTVEMWVNPTTLPGFALMDFRGATNNVAPSLEVSNTGMLYIYKEGATTLITATTAIKAGLWNHVAYVRSAGYLNLYVNGVQVATPVADSTNWSAPSGKINIGCNKDAGGVLTGYITELRVTKGVARTITVPTQQVKTT